MTYEINVWIHTGSNCPIPNAWTTWPSIQICGKPSACVSLQSSEWADHSVTGRSVWFLTLFPYCDNKAWSQMSKTIKTARTTSGGSRIYLTIPRGVKLFNAQFYPKKHQNKGFSTFFLIDGILLVLLWICQWIDETLDWSANDWLVKPRSCNLIYTISQHSVVLRQLIMFADCVKCSYHVHKFISYLRRLFEKCMKFYATVWTVNKEVLCSFNFSHKHHCEWRNPKL